MVINVLLYVLAHSREVIHTLLSMFHNSLILRIIKKVENLVLISD